jgi:hypothetical protein
VVSSWDLLGLAHLPDPGRGDEGTDDVLSLR